MNPLRVRCTVACWHVFGDDPCPCAVNRGYCDDVPVLTALAGVEAMLALRARSRRPQPPRGQPRPREDGEYRRYREAMAR